MSGPQKRSQADSNSDGPLRHHHPSEATFKRQVIFIQSILYPLSSRSLDASAVHLEYDLDAQHGV
jgi:hypothetical protein